MSKKKSRVFNQSLPVASFDSASCYQAAVNHLMEEGACSSEEAARKHKRFDSLVEEYMEIHWFEMEETAQELCQLYFKDGAGMVCPAFGWTRCPTATNFDTNAFAAFKRAYLAECTIYVYLKKNSTYGVHLEVVVAHHDSPTGDHCYLVRKKYHAQFILKHFGVKE